MSKLNSLCYTEHELPRQIYALLRHVTHKLKKITDKQKWCGGGGAINHPCVPSPQIITCDVNGFITLLWRIYLLNRNIKCHTPGYFGQMRNDDCSSSKIEGVLQK